MKNYRRPTQSSALYQSGACRGKVRECHGLILPVSSSQTLGIEHGLAADLTDFYQPRTTLQKLPGQPSTGNRPICNSPSCNSPFRNLTQPSPTRTAPLAQVIS